MNFAYEFVAPLLVIGAAGFFVLALVLPVAAPNFKRPFLATWIWSSCCFSLALFIEEIVMQEGSLASALAWALSAWLGLALITWLVYRRIHMWDHLAAAQERRAQEEQNARYRPKDFAE